MIRKKSSKYLLPMVVACYVLTQMQVFDNFAGLPHRRANEVEDQDKMKNRKLKIDFYGGSITYGKGMKDLKNKRYSTIVGEKLDVNVLNKGVVAAGVSRHITCGKSNDKHNYYNNEISRCCFLVWCKAYQKLMFLSQSLESMNFLQDV